MLTFIVSFLRKADNFTIFLALIVKLITEKTKIDAKGAISKVYKQDGTVTKPRLCYLYTVNWNFFFLLNFRIIFVVE